ANNAPHIACQRSSPSPASFLVSFEPFVEETWSSRDQFSQRPAGSARRALCFVDRSKCARSRVPTTKGSKDNEQDARDGEDRNRARPSIIVHVPGVGHARERRTSYRVSAIFPITCILFVILWTLRRGDLVSHEETDTAQSLRTKHGPLGCRVGVVLAR